MSLRAELVRRRSALIAVPVLATAAAWALHHIIELFHGTSTQHGRFAIVYTVLCGLFAWQVALFFGDRPATTTPRQQANLDALRILAVIPCYNERTDAMRREVDAILAGDRHPTVLYVVDDGTRGHDYTELRRWFRLRCADHGVVGYWARQDNAGKRHAQATAIHAACRTHRIDIIWTLDSDAQPDPRCLDEALKPFVDPDVTSVASIVVTANTRDSLLARVMDLIFVGLQLTDRSAMSAAGSVMVNSGASALYRANIVLANLDGYLAETFFNRPVAISDDSMLTLFALLQGRTVQQPTSIVFTTMPHRLRQHITQQKRWARGSFIRSWWRMRYLPTRRFAYWWHLLRWSGFAVNTAVLGYVTVIYPLHQHHGYTTTAQLLGWSAVIQTALGYTLMLRYLAIRRSDQTLRYQLGTYALTPLAVIWSITVLRAIRWHAMLTCLDMRWGTRGEAAPADSTGDRPAPADRDAVTALIPRIRS